MQKRISILLLVTLTLLSCQNRREGLPIHPHMAWEDASPVDFVNPLVGTLSSYELSTGNTYPVIATPWGAHFWTPQTGKNGDGWAYRYDENRIRGFKQTHQPSPWMNDYGAFSIMPVTTGPVFDEEGRASWFSHKAETATPYYYKVYLASHDVTVEMTPIRHAAGFRLTYPARNTSYLVVDAYEGGSVRLVDEYTIAGYSVQNHGGVAEGFHNWFVIKSDTPMKAYPADGKTVLAGFHTRHGQVVNLRVASSFISAQQAEVNLGETGNFEDMIETARTAWNDVLSYIEVEDDNLEHLRTFYSCLYRCLLFPRDISEIDQWGKRLHYSPHTGTVEKGYFFTDTGFWDTFRSLFPLLNLVYPMVSQRIQNGLVEHYQESGFLPEWSSPGHRNCMVGNNSASIVADAYLSGVRGQDIDQLWKAVTHGAHSVHPEVSSTGRLGWQYYDSLGYVPCDVGIDESAARTLEYAYDDWCIWRLGEALGRPEEEIAPYKAAAMNYRNLFDLEYSLMNGRTLAGELRRPFSPLKWGGDFTEGNAYHYTWSVFHDIQGLIDLMGGDKAFTEQLDAVFKMPPTYDDSYYGFPIHEIVEMAVMNMGNYAHGNQPIQHMLYLYDWCGQPWKTQTRVREVMEKFYGPWADGYCGDEDNGQTSAWYVFSALGFYPVCPGSGEFVLGAPFLPEMTLQLDNGATFTVRAPKVSTRNRYVRSVKLNGQKYTKRYIAREDILRGGVLEFEMADKPVKKRRPAAADLPYSLSQ